MKALLRVLVLIEKAEMLKKMQIDTQNEIRSILIGSNDENVKRVVAEFAKQYGWEVKAKN